MERPKTSGASAPVNPTFGAMNTATYSAKINTPARNPDYFSLFHAPLVERAVGSTPGGRISLIDVACGPAQELDFLKDDPRVQLIGIDMARNLLTEARERLPSARFHCYDVRNDPPLPSEISPGSADAGIALNAMIYVPERMLAALRYGLRSGGEAAVNFRVYGNPFNEAFYRHYTQMQGVIREEEITVPALQGGRERFVMAALDYTRCIDPSTGEPDPIRNLVVQQYFRSKEDIIRLIGICGFEIAAAAPFHFSSPVNPDNEIEVYSIRKP